jgi:hypothetical protein
MLKLTIGEFTHAQVAEPTLGGWQDVLGCLSADDLEAISGLLSDTFTAAGGEDASESDLATIVVNGVTPILSKAPKLASAFMGACLRDKDGQPIGDKAKLGNLTDLLKFCEFLIENECFDSLISTAKNGIGARLMDRTPESGPAGSPGNG